MGTPAGNAQPADQPAMPPERATTSVPVAGRVCKVHLCDDDQSDPASARSGQLGQLSSHHGGQSVEEQFRGMTKHPRFLRMWYSLCNLLNTLCCAIIWVRSSSRLGHTMLGTRLAGPGAHIMRVGRH